MKDHDPINHPDHYTVGGIEVIDVMKAKSSHEEFIGHLRLTALKYISRGPFKENALKDYKKAVWYLNRLIQEMEASQHKLEDTKMHPNGYYTAQKAYCSSRDVHSYPEDRLNEKLKDLLPSRK